MSTEGVYLVPQVINLGEISYNHSKQYKVSEGDLKLGRNSPAELNITDKRCSRFQAQLSVKSSNDKFQVTITPKGVNPCSIFKKGETQPVALTKDQIYSLNDGDVFSLLITDINFLCVIRNKSNKRKFEEEEEEVNRNRKRQKIEHSSKKNQENEDNDVEDDGEDREANDGREHCSYGAKCYRKNPSHFQEFYHPHVDKNGKKKIIYKKEENSQKRNTRNKQDNKEKEKEEEEEDQMEIVKSDSRPNSKSQKTTNNNNKNNTKNNVEKEENNTKKRTINNNNNNNTKNKNIKKDNNKNENNNKENNKNRKIETENYLKKIQSINQASKENRPITTEDPIKLEVIVDRKAVPPTPGLSRIFQESNEDEPIKKTAPIIFAKRESLRLPSPVKPSIPLNKNIRQNNNNNNNNGNDNNDNNKQSERPKMINPRTLTLNDFTEYEGTEDGNNTLTITSISTDNHSRFDPEDSLPIIADVITKFMERTKEKKLNVIFADENFGDDLQNLLKGKIKGWRNRFQIVDSSLDRLSACRRHSRFVVCPVNWRFKPISQGRSLYKGAGASFLKNSIKKQFSIAKRGEVYPIEVPQSEFATIRQSQSTQVLLLVNGPNRNPSKPDYIKNNDVAEEALRDTFEAIFECFEKLCS